MDDRLWRRSLSHQCFSQTHGDSVAAGGRFRLNPLFNTSGKNQQTALSTRVLNRYTHECVDQFLQHDLARDCLGDFDNGSQIQLFDRCPDRAGRAGYWFLLPEVRIQGVELPHFTNGFPTEVTVSGLAQVGIRDLLETTCHVEAGRNFVGHTLNMDETVLSCGADGLFVKVHGLTLLAPYSSDLRTDKSGATFEILRAILRPYFELSMVRGQGLKMLPLSVGICR